MRPFTIVTAVAAPLLRANINTDEIIPSREIKSVSKSGLADGLFAGWRYLSADGREANADFVLNQAAYRGAEILLGGENFGCGSSREHAVWALAEYGFRAVLAPSFNPIFHGNCVRNGLVPVELGLGAIEALIVAIAPDPQARPLTIDLPAQRVLGGELVFDFPMEAEAKTMLLNGYDAIDLTQMRAAKIEAFRKADAAMRPWIYAPGA